MANYDVFTVCEKGQRASNQDSYAVPTPSGPDLFIVCDGVGGIPGGELASRLVCRELPGFFSGNGEYQSLSEFLNQKFKKHLNQIPPEKIRASTTLTFAKLENNKALIGWCGDSRVYHIRKGEILFQTEDHSLVNEMVFAGELTKEQARYDYRKHIILRAVDLLEEAEIDYQQIVGLLPDDYLVLVTDGILESFNEEEIKKYFDGTKKMEEIQRKVKSVCQNSSDNYTMIAVKIK